jgi:hypothetical protein
VKKFEPTNRIHTDIPNQFREREDHTGTQGMQKQNYLLPQPNKMRTVTGMGATKSLI